VGLYTPRNEQPPPAQADARQMIGLGRAANRLGAGLPRVLTSTLSASLGMLSGRVTRRETQPVGSAPDAEAQWPSTENREPWKTSLASTP
jgi:hypothetical protein